MSLWVTATDPVELRPGATEEDLQVAIDAAYKQVLGNQHVLESDRLVSAESMLRNGEITVRGFVSMVAKSELYQSLFFNSSSPYRFVELNFKHLLGRAPASQAEISEHVQIYNQQGVGAEIDSYISSDEYIQNFGENIVPYTRGASTQTGLANVVFNRTFALVRGNSSSDSGNKAKLITEVAANRSTKITAPGVGSGTPGNTSKRFRIVVSKAGATPVYKQSGCVYEVGYDQMSQKIQNIHKTGGKILSITEVA